MLIGGSNCTYFYNQYWLWQLRFLALFFFQVFTVKNRRVGNFFCPPFNYIYINSIINWKLRRTFWHSILSMTTYKNMLNQKSMIYKLFLSFQYIPMSILESIQCLTLTLLESPPNLATLCTERFKYLIFNDFKIWG